MVTAEEMIAALQTQNNILKQQVTDLQKDSTEKLNQIRALQKDNAVLQHSLRSLMESKYNGRDLPFMVAEFHTKFGIPMATEPHIPPDEEVRLRLRLIGEEFFELLEATVAFGDWDEEWQQVLGAISNCPIRVNLVGVADAIADTLYTLEGAALVFGIDTQGVLVVVHENNLTKERGAGGGKIVKGRTWVAPDVRGELIRQGWRP